ncbi:hypothetical protein FOZ60_007436 [Perkinsus olseni]|uniref:Uncharacterized protein n=1 Tax=Perkinsus olseni TaxID=32597 RepID=A0A7J6PMW7_PEROL|nr:hypothetical protein FOZ60_007436 [Perkinsus olseni]
MAPPTHYLLNALLRVWLYLYSTRASSRDREVLTEDREFMSYSEPRESREGKERPQLIPEGKELMEGVKFHSQALQRATVLGFGRADSGRDLQVRLGFDVTGAAAGQRKLTDFAELHYRGNSPYSIFRMNVDAEAMERARKRSFWLLRDSIVKAFNDRMRQRHVCKSKTEVIGAGVQGKKHRSVTLGTFRITLTLTDPADGFEIVLLTATIHSK